MPMNERKFIDVDGISTCYYEQGEGPILVLFHGGNFGSNDAADCALDWALNFDELSEKYRVFAIDKIGQGYTANPKNDGDYTMDHTYTWYTSAGFKYNSSVASEGADAVNTMGLDVSTTKAILNKFSVTGSFNYQKVGEADPSMGLNVRFSYWVF